MCMNTVHISCFKKAEGFNLLQKMQICGHISHKPQAAIIPRGIILKSCRESTVVNAVWQVSVIFTALPSCGLME